AVPENCRVTGWPNARHANASRAIESPHWSSHLSRCGRNSSMSTLATRSAKTPDPRLPRMVQAAGTPGKVSMQVTLTGSSGGAGVVVEDLRLVGVERQPAGHEVDAGQDRPVRAPVEDRPLPHDREPVLVLRG